MSFVFRMLTNETLEEDEFSDLHHNDDDDDNKKPWGDVILASFLIQLVTVTGLMVTVAVGYFGKLRGNHSELIHTMSFQIIPSFACGALLATAVFLVIPESLVLLGGGHSEEHEEVRLLRRFLEEEEEEEDLHEDDRGNEAAASWKFGASLLSGFLFPILLHVFFPERDHILEEEVKETVQEHAVNDNVTNTANGFNHNQQQPLEEEEEENSDKSPASTEVTEDNTANQLKQQKPIDWTLACSILVGDFFHNFTDGIFVGTAFLLCDRNVGYTIVATTIYHELAQEIADFALLHHHCGIVAWKAVLYNFLSGFSVMIGALMILSFDLTETAQGVTLAIAAGIYIYIAACECVPRIQAVRKGPKDTLLFVGFFILGVVPIGLVLLKHNHCEGNDSSYHDGEEGEEEHVARLLF
eukprot:scaffold875_cov185-Amphora_coffeaeformis.AAC.9